MLISKDQIKQGKQKVNNVVVSTVKNMVDAGTKDYVIADAFGMSVATVQNIKRTGYNYGKYRKLINNQMESWKKIRDDKSNGKTNNSVFVYGADFDRLEGKIDLLLSKFNSVFPKVK